jgi:hypothetical protein
LATGRIQVTDSAELQLTEGTCIIFGDFDNQTTDEVCVTKRDAGGLNWNWYYGATQLHMYDGSVFSDLTYDITGSKFLAVTFKHQEAPKFYVDGAYVGDGDAAIDVVVDDAPVNIASQYVDNVENTNPIRGAKIFNEVLSADRILEEYKNVARVLSPRRTKKNFVFPFRDSVATKVTFGSEQMTDGDMEGVDTSAWTAGNSAVLSKETENPHGGTQVLRVMAVIGDYPFAQQASLAVGKEQRITGWARGNGTRAPRVGISTTTIWEGTSSTEWQKFDVITTPASENLRLTCVTTGTGTADFDDVSVKTIQKIIGAWDGELSNGVAVDVSGNGHNSVTAVVNQLRKFFGKVFSFDGQTTTILFGDVAAFENLPEATVCFWAKNDWSSIQYWVHKWISANNHRWAIYSNTTNLLFGVGDGVDTPAASIAVPSDSDWHLVLGTFDGNEIILYVDNIASAPVAQVGNMGGSGNAANFEMGYLTQAATGRVKGELCRVRFFNRVVTAEERKNLYLEGARLLTFLDDQSDALISFANETGTYLSDTKWKISSGTWKIQDKTGGLPGEKEIHCVAAGVLYQGSNKVYGTWEFDLYTTDAGQPVVMLLADTIGGRSASGQDGYYFYLSSAEAVGMGESTNGTPSDAARSADSYIAPATWYRYRITRAYNGQFTFYIKGGVYTEWTQVPASVGANPWTDNTVVTSSYFCIDLDAGEKIRDLRFMHGVVEP